MDNYICINGEKTELTREQLEKLGIKFPDNNPCSELKYIESYFFINSFFEVEETYFFEGCSSDRFCINSGNYCRDRDLMQQRAMHMQLNQLLWNYSIRCGEHENAWNGHNCHYKILDDMNEGFFVDTCATVKSEGAIYFPTHKDAQYALDNIIKPFMKEHPEFVW